jgi:hypothetical protein
MILDPVPAVDLRRSPAAWGGWGTHMMDCAAVCLAESGHTGVTTLEIVRKNFSLDDLRPPGETVTIVDLRLHAKLVDNGMTDLFRNLIAATEHGAYAIALGAILVLDPYDSLQGGMIYEGFDFLLKRGGALQARIEVSGVLRNGDRAMDRLIKKLKQVNRYQSPTGGYAAVVDFSHPRLIVGYAK